MPRKKIRGFLTEEQLKVLRLRLDGLTQEDVASKLGTTRQNISLIERRAHTNIDKAKKTLQDFRKIQSVAIVNLPISTHLVDVPRMLIDAADNVGVKIRVDFTMVYKELHEIAGNSISGTRVVKPIIINILRDGDIQIEEL